MRRILILIAAVAMLVVALPVAASAGKPPADGPNKVWICHFDGHSSDSWTGGGTTLDGDWVITHLDGTPTARQFELCEDEKGGNLILVSVNAMDGHGAQLQDRTSSYPRATRAS
jgi:hypothetical protein